MKRVIALMLIIMIFFTNLMLMCSCENKSHSQNSVATSHNNYSSMVQSSEAGSSINLPTVSNKSECNLYISQETMASATEKATHIMYALCGGVLENENENATYLFAPIYQFKGEVLKNSFIVTVPLSEVSHRNTYAPSNYYALWLTYDEKDDRYVDLFFRTEPLIEVDILPLPDDERVELNKSIINANYETERRIREHLE